jgi:hypothetical protein
LPLKNINSLLPDRKVKFSVIHWQFMRVVWDICSRPKPAESFHAEPSKYYDLNVPAAPTAPKSGSITAAQYQDTFARHP